MWDSKGSNGYNISLYKMNRREKIVSELQRKRHDYRKERKSNNTIQSCFPWQISYLKGEN